MGLDIIQGFDLGELDEDFELDEEGQFELSRTFCNFMCRKGVVDGEADLDQIGRIMNVDIATIYAMESYTPEWEFDEIPDFVDDAEEEKKQLEAQNAKLEGNIDLIISTLSALIPKLEKEVDLSEKIDDNGLATISDSYYKNLNTQEKGGYIENNLIQDLRNILGASTLAKSKGGKTTFFTYG